MNKRNLVLRILDIRAPAWLIGLTAVLSAHRIDAQVVYPLQMIPAGTIVVDAKADHWNELVLLARPTLTSGDVDQLPPGLQQAVTRYAYTVLATITKSSRLAEKASSSGPYELAEVGVGYSAPVDGVPVVVSATQNSQTGDLGMIDSQVVAQNERDLMNAQVVVRSSTLIMFDMDAVLARQGGHRVEPLRTLVWIDPKTGKSAIAMWLIERPEDGSEKESSWRVRSDPMQVHSGGKRDSNRLHVDASTFILGIPTATSFGLERLLPGKAITWTDGLRDLAAESSYTEETLGEFTAVLNQAIERASIGP